MFRVYDTEQKCWLKDNVYLNANDELYLIKPSLFGLGRKPVELTPDRYIWHRDINLRDKDDYLIFEGDILEAKVNDDKVVKGLVTYAPELSSYIILCYDLEEYYTLGTEVVSLIKIIGNVFDGCEEVNQDGERALQR